MSLRNRLATLALGLPLALSACTGSTENSRVNVSGPTVGNGAQGGAQQPQVSSRSKLMFDDALKSFEAQKKARAFDYPALKRKFEAVVEEEPKFAEANYNLGVIAERSGNLEEAVAQYKQALKVKPSLHQAAENLGVILQNRGDIPNAVAVYQQILEVYPDDASSRARLAEIYRQNGEYDRAIEFSREALIRDPKTLAAYKVMMLTNVDRKQFALAKLVALRALKLDENDPELYHTIGIILLQEGDPSKARGQFQKAVEVRADYLPSRVALAKIALDGENYVGAEEHLRKILQADGKNAEALLNLGVAYKGQGQYDKALQVYDQVEKLKPELASTWFNRGLIYGEHKQAPEKAIEFYKRYLQLAGGENALSGDAAVFQKIKAAEGMIAAKEEEKRALEEAAKMEAEAKRMEEEAKKQEEQQKREEAKANVAKDALAPDAAGDKKPAAAADSKPAAKAEPKKEEKKPAPSVQPAKGSQKAAEPGDEPSDGL